MRLRSHLAVAASFVAIVALGLWLGGLLVLGAIVAPIVFRTVPFPANADAMTVVFRRFDNFALACAVGILLAEVVLGALRQEKFTKLDLARGVAVALASLGCVIQALWVSPRIASLHEEGVRRGIGDGGNALDQLHHVAQGLGKSEALFGLLGLALHVLTVSSATARKGEAGSS